MPLRVNDFFVGDRGLITDFYHKIELLKRTRKRRTIAQFPEEKINPVLISNPIKQKFRYQFFEYRLIKACASRPEDLSLYGNNGLPLSSTHRFDTRTTPFQHPKSLRSTSKSLSSTPKTPQFNTKTLSVPHQRPLSSTPSSVPHH